MFDMCLVAEWTAAYVVNSLKENRIHVGLFFFEWRLDTISKLYGGLTRPAGHVYTVNAAIGLLYSQ